MKKPILILVALLLPIMAMAGPYASSAAYGNSLIIKNSRGRLASILVYNSKASAQFIQLHDSATVPADTAVPVVTLTVPASSNLTFFFGIEGMEFQNGIVICNSSTGPTKTIGSADCYFTGSIVTGGRP